MEEDPYLPHSLEQTVRWALREQVGDAEPSPAAWQGIRRCIQGGESAPAVERPTVVAHPCRRRLVAQAAAVACVLVSIGFGVASSRAPLNERPTDGCEDSASMPLVPGREDTLSARLIWLAGKEKEPFDYLRVRGYPE